MNTLPSLMLLDDSDLATISADREEAGLGALRTERGLLPLEAVDLVAEVDGLTAHVRLTQTFVNVHADPLEATYLFPLPERAGVLRFQLRVGGRLVEGELKERGAARREYREALAQGHQAAIAEEERPGTFTIRVGNIPPGERATVHLELAQPLPSVDGEATFRFPLVVAPRYIPGTPLGRPPVGSGTVPDTDAVPDASRISPPVLLPGFPNPVVLSLRVLFPPSDLQPLAIRSSLHAVLEEPGEGRCVRVLAGERLDRDFILRFRLGDRAIRTGLMLHPDADGQGGTFALTVLPPALEQLVNRPRDLVFLLDRSGSMSGWKMVAARRAGMRLIESLTDRDRFTIYAFDDRIETPARFNGDSLVSATFGHRTQALEFLQEVGSQGGTEMARPLDLALARLLEAGSDVGIEATRDKVLVLITDGQVGNEPQILRQLGARLGQVRVHALGIDQAVNAAFLQQLADLGGGSSVLVESEQRLEEAIDPVQRRIATPALSGLTIRGDGLCIDEESVVPARLPDLFVGTPVVVMGRYTGPSDGALVVTGASAESVAWSVRVPARRQTHPAVPALWARQRLRDLEDRYTIAPAADLERQIVEVSLRFGVLCRFTSFVAVDRSRVVSAGGEQHQVTQPLDLPAGWAEPELAFEARENLMLASATPCFSVGSLLEFDDTLIEEARFQELEPAPEKKRRKRKAAPPADGSAEKQKEAGSDLLDRLRQVAGVVRDGVHGLVEAGKHLSDNPLDRSQFQVEVTALVAVLQNATTHPAKIAILNGLVERLSELVLKAARAGDLSPELLRLAAAVQHLVTLAGQDTVAEATLVPAWDETYAALHAYQELVEPKAFWK